MGGCGRWTRTPASVVRRRGSSRGSRSSPACDIRRSSPTRRTPYAPSRKRVRFPRGARKAGLRRGTVVEVPAHYEYRAARVTRNLLRGAPHDEPSQPAELLAEALVPHHDHAGDYVLAAAQDLLGRFPDPQVGLSHGSAGLFYPFDLVVEKRLVLFSDLRFRLGGRQRGGGTGGGDVVDPTHGDHRQVR